MLIYLRPLTQDCQALCILGMLDMSPAILRPDGPGDGEMHRAHAWTAQLGIIELPTQAEGSILGRGRAQWLSAPNCENTR